MSQTTATPAVPGTGAAPAPGRTAAPGRPAPSGGRAQVREAVRGLMSGTPGRMRLLGAVSALAAVLFGAAAAVNLAANDAAIERAAGTTAQVVRAQGMYADLLLADATATSSFLVGGLEKPEQRDIYQQAMGRVAAGIAEAARAEPADGAALAALNTSVQTYAQLVEQARAYNRQGLPVGAQYLKLASAGLRSDTLPILDAITTANTSRSAEEFGHAGSVILLLVGGLLSLLVFGYVLVWLARRTHRAVNIPLAAGAVGIVVALVIGLVIANRAAAQVDRLRGDQFAATVALATARASAYDAKSNEALTLIARGSGGSFEKSWKASSQRVVSSLATLKERASGADTAGRLSTAWTGYTTAHQAVRAADDGGSWDKAVGLARATGTGSTNAAFDLFDHEASAEVATLSQDAADQLASSRGGLGIIPWVLLLLALACAVAALRGVGQRIEEYR